MRQNINEFVLICPRNDEEALQILKIAKKICLPVVISQQPHGAKLDKEPNLLSRIQEANPEACNVVIVELPGLKTEDELRKQGYELVIIDHHRYEETDRSNDKSSLHQFLKFMQISDSDLRDLGFDPEMVHAVAIMDAEFIWGLQKRGFSNDAIVKILNYWRKLTLELGDKRRQKEENEAKKVWQNRQEKGDLIIVKSNEDNISIRDALSFLLAQTYGKPKPLYIRQGNRRVYMQDVGRRVAEKLHEQFGGFLFGQNKCWGILVDDSESLPTLEEILEAIQGIPWQT
ncbi:hypothetical protein D6827_03305 [Candidatus Parcubacteria bacterium]|nr:MAG: hypothetical protein D6827_03305 [Candidatus Parcubacteria bacterium]